MDRSGAFQRCEVLWPEKADSTDCPEGPAWAPDPQARPLHVPPAGTPCCPPRLSHAERQQSDKPGTGLWCLFTKHRGGPLGSPPPARPSATSGERGFQASPGLLIPRMLTSRNWPQGGASSLAQQQERVWLDTKKILLPRIDTLLRGSRTF